MSVNLVTRAYQVTHAANPSKVARLQPLLAPYQEVCAQYLRLARRYAVLAGNPIPQRPKLTESVWKVPTTLSARHQDSAWAQTYSMLSSWEEAMVTAIRSIITHSSLTADTRHVLHRLNVRRWWFNTDATLLWWYTSDGSRHSEKTPVEPAKRIEHRYWIAEEQVHPEHLRLLRCIARQAMKQRARFPQPKKSQWLRLDGKVARLEVAQAGLFTHWLSVSTLEFRKQVKIPLVLTEYATKAPGSFANHAQLCLQDGSLAVTLVKRTTSAPLRPETGRTLALDYGMASLFTDNRGSRYGRTLFDWLKLRDTELQALAKALQRQSMKLRNSKRYQALTHRIREHVVNEVNRVLNKIASDADLSTLVVEDLDFRNGGMSRRMNRLLNLFGRGAVRAKLIDLTEIQGVRVTEVVSAYTSQECSGCGFVSKTNRRRQAVFCCRFCGLRLHADVNAARAILGRSKDPYFSSGDTSSTSSLTRRRILALLDCRFRIRWGTSFGRVERASAGYAFGEGLGENSVPALLAAV